MRLPALSAALLAAGVVLLAAGAVLAQSLPEREWGEPWNGVGYGVRATGLGGAYTAVADDFDGAYWNPGGLVRMRDTQIGFVTGDAAWQRRFTTKAGASTVPYLFGLGFVTAEFKPWAAGLNIIRSFHSESFLPWQEDFYMGTFVLPLNAARTAGLGVNVKYMFSDYWYTHPFVGGAGVLNPATGWAADAGFYFSIPLPLRDRRREINLGATARNLVGQSRVLNTQRTMPSEASLGFSFVFDDLVPRERSLVALDYNQAMRATLGSYDTQLRLGFEQWFFQNNAAFRFGYATPFPRYDAQESQLMNPVSFASGTYSYLSQGRPIWAGGVTVSLFKFQVNLAVTVPVETVKAEKFPDVPEVWRVNGASSSGAATAKAMDKTRFYLSVLYHLGAGVTAPYAKVSVEPLVFAPKKGEVAVFTIDYKDERGIDFWSLEIKNSARVPVRTYSGRGAPPERLVWDGLDDRFNLAPDDDYTYTLTVRNRDRVETITAPQSLRVFTPGEVKATSPDLTPLQRINEENQRREEAAKAAVKPLINTQLRSAKESFAPAAVGTPAEPGEGPALLVPAPIQAPAPETATASSAPGAETPYTAYRGIAPEQILRIQVPSAGKPGEPMVLDYQSEQYVLRYLLREVKSLTEQSFANIGGTAGSFMVQARYGNHLLVAQTPVAVVRGLREGRLDDTQWVRAATITLDGQAISPDLR